MTLADELTSDMLSDIARYKLKTKTAPTAFLQMITTHGGVETARRLIASSQAQEGFTRAWEYGALHLTAEYLVVFGRSGRYNSLFTEEEIAKAKKRLYDHGLTTEHPEGL